MHRPNTRRYGFRQTTNIMKCKLFNHGWNVDAITDEALKKFRRVNNTSFPYDAYSIYNNGSEKTLISTLNEDIYEAAMIYTGMKKDKTAGAVGFVNNNVSIAETPIHFGIGETVGMTIYDTVVFNNETRVFHYFGKDSTGKINSVNLNKGSSTKGEISVAAFFLALLPFMVDDTELQEALAKMEAEIYPPGSNEYIANILLICDNIYRRIEGGLFEVSIPDDGCIWQLNTKDFNNGTYVPCRIIAGEFQQEELSEKAKVRQITTVGKAKDIYWKEKNWTEEEKMLVPVLDDKMKIPPEVLEIADYIRETGQDITPARNFMLRGITGYGKSTIVTILGAITNTPVVRITCHPTMETNDFLTKFIPDCNNQTMNYAEMPTFEDIANDPETAYEMLTGEKKSDITCEACLLAYAQAYAAKQSNAPKFKLVESDYVKGLSRGWIVEIQEPSVIMNGGVLTGLNEFDHIGSVIPMPDGSYRRRHKDAVVIYTDNVTYEGCRPLNQSVIRRNFMAFDLYSMNKSDILARVKFNTKFKDTKTLKEMYDTWLDIQRYCKENAVTDGSVSIVELENWALAMRIRNDFRTTCIRTVVSKATAYQDEQEMIIAQCLDTRSTSANQF